MADADEDLDALLDDALEGFDQEAKHEEERLEEKRKKEKEKVPEGSGGDDELTGLLEKTLLQLSENGEEEDDNLKQLVEQGLNLMKGDGGMGDDEEVFKKCLGLLESVTKEISKGGEEEAGPMAAMNPLMQQLSAAVGDVVQGLQDGEGGEGSDALGTSKEDQEKLLNVMKELGAATGSSPAEGAEGEMQMPAGFSEEMMESILKGFDPSAAGTSGAGELPGLPGMEEMMKAMGAGGEGGGNPPDIMAALQSAMSSLGDAAPQTEQDKAELAKLKEEMRTSLDELPEEMRSGVTDMLSSLDNIGGGEGAAPATEAAASITNETTPTEVHADPAAEVETKEME